MPNGKTTENISISLPSNLVQILDHCAGRMDISRSDLMRRALKRFILFHAVELSGLGADLFWGELYKKIFDK